MDWARALEQFDQPPPLLAELAPSARNDRGPAADLPAPNSLVDALAAAPAEARRDLTVAHVEEQLARVLGLRSSAAIDREQDLTELGMDSLTAVELTNRLRSSTGLALESTLVFDQATVNAVAGYLFEQLDRLVAVKARIAAMSPDEVARALAARRTGAEGSR
jgi:acyl carrier protein